MQSLQVLLTEFGLERELFGWQLTYALGVSSDGRTVAGFATDPLGRTEAFVAVIPEPGTALLLGLGLACLAGVRWR